VSDNSWRQARLIPTSGISDGAEQERRATSALLAVLAEVREFGRAVTAPLGAPAGSIEAFVEVPFGSGGPDQLVDGLIRVRRGTRIWTALVAAKTGTGAVDPAELERYLSIAQEHDFDAVLTISNQIVALTGLQPLARQHRSWGQLLAEAVSHRERCAATDPARAWVLGELIGYLEHPRSGVLELEDRSDLSAQTLSAPARLTIDMTSLDVTAVSVSLEPVVRVPPMHPSRREMRLARPLEFGDGPQAGLGPEAGWYQDPADVRQLRWYDGSAWSDRTYPVVALA
jgi:hypothetical protein